MSLQASNGNILISLVHIEDRSFLTLLLTPIPYLFRPQVLQNWSLEERSEALFYPNACRVPEWGPKGAYSSFSVLFPLADVCINI
jgi:hypothetical protein